MHNYGTALSTGGPGTNGTGAFGNAHFAGKPAPPCSTGSRPSTAGTYTGQNQAGWSVTGNGQYVVYGRRVPAGQRHGQQGLVRFAAPAAPNKIGPDARRCSSPTATAVAAGAVRVTLHGHLGPGRRDPDLPLIRDGAPPRRSTTTDRPRRWWTRAGAGVADTGLAAGSAHLPA